MIPRFIITAFVLLLSISTGFSQTYNCIDTIGYSMGRVRCVALSPTTKYVAEASDANGIITIWVADSNKVYQKLSRHNALINTLTYSQNGAWLLSASNDGYVFLWDVKKGNILRKYGDGRTAVRFASFGKNDGEIMYGGDDKKIHCIKKYWLPEAEGKVLASAAEIINCGAYSYDYKYFAFASNNLLYLLNTDNNQMKVIAGSSAPISQLAWDPSCKRIAVRCTTRMIDVWDIRTETKRSLLAYSSVKSFTDSTQLLYPPDGQLLLSGSIDRLPTFWDMDRMESKYNLFGHTNSVRALAVSRDGKIIATGSSDSTVRLWYLPDAIVLTEENKKKMEDAKKRRAVDNLDTAKTGDIASNITMSANSIPILLNDRKINPAKNVDVHSKRVTFYVWDDDQIDGDIISLNLNGKWILQRYKLVKQKHPITVSLDESGNNFLLLYAHNEGDVSPNTAGVSIYDGFAETKLMLKSDLKTCDAIRMKVKQ